MYKLALNQNCDTDEKFWTAPDMIAYWGRFIDCAEMDVFCDARLDEITDCNRLFTYHVFWQNGIDRYE
ncbi:unnamed protein product [Heligmosomoides polygyrus]|uniref:Uncharacterized protein n=1 Tax=Heligmosomoides polygyrus TaxID=6339 RepID=A0A3P7UDG1_HELPZ|nr:unnamed protein product [Heligmosomoides polygyrus]